MAQLFSLHCIWALVEPSNLATAAPAFALLLFAVGQAIVNAS
jgi:hypothetical protein